MADGAGNRSAVLRPSKHHEVGATSAAYGPTQRQPVVEGMRRHSGTSPRDLVDGHELLVGGEAFRFAVEVDDVGRYPAFAGLADLVPGVRVVGREVRFIAVQIARREANHARPQAVAA